MSFDEHPLTSDSYQVTHLHDWIICVFAQKCGQIDHGVVATGHPVMLFESGYTILQDYFFEVCGIQINLMMCLHLSSILFSELPIRIVLVCILVVFL